MTACIVGVAAVFFVAGLLTAVRYMHVWLAVMKTDELRALAAKVERRRNR